MNQLKIGNLSFEGRAFLAPMAGATDASYRKICAEFGACGTVTEMVSSRALLYSYKRTNEIIDISGDIRPTAIQIFGDDPQIMARAAEIVLSEKPDFIDINMGCPVPKVAGNNCGSALMKNPALCGRIVAAISRAIPVPITVKIRKGWDNNSVNALEVAKYCQEAGAKAVFLHGRTREQMYRPSADWQIIKDVKEALSIPVIGNGDVDSAAAAAKMLEETGCDGVMVGRAALGNPWIFREINGYIGMGEIILPPPSINEKIIVVKKHIEALCTEKGEERGMRESRKHVGWYLHGVRGAAEFRRKAGMLTTLADLDLLLKELYIASR